jgi:two-component system sensor histidine kinase CpxA
MKMRIPLATKFAGWLLLNLLVLALGAAAFVGAQFRGGFDSLLAGGAGKRVEALALAVGADLRAHPRSEWNSALEKLSASYGTPISLYQCSGTSISGASYDLPVSVATELDKIGRAPPERHNPPPPKKPPHPPEKASRDMFGDRQRHDPPFDSPPGSEKQIPGMPRRDPSLGPPPNEDSRESFDQSGQMPDPHRWPKFLLHASSPNAYWIGIRIPVPDGSRTGPMALLIRCSSLAQGGLLLETKPLIIGGAAAVIVSILIWLPFVLALTWQVRRVTAATGQVARGDFDVRLPVKRRDELGELASSVNAMAGQLDRFAHGQKRFMGDVAHELTSPIARMQTALAILEESGLDRDPTSYYASLREELDEMSRLVAELLEFSKAAMQREIRLGPVALAQLVTDVIHREGGGAQVETDVPETLTANAEPKLLARALGNIVRNAVRYAGHAGPILISAVARPGHVEILVTDTGPGVPPESLPRLFDAFYRPDAARTREAGGAGLGLAIVKTCVEACGGAVAARNRSSRGLQVIMALRRSEPALPQE